MDDTNYIATIADYNRFLGLSTASPLLSVHPLSDAQPKLLQPTTLGFYALFFQDFKSGDSRYGYTNVDQQGGTMLAYAPGHVINLGAKITDFQPDGEVLLFHKDLLRGSELARAVDRYTFFSYRMNEALHLTAEERAILHDCIEKIRLEISGEIDRHSRRLVVAHLTALLDYCLRFFERQFETRVAAGNDLVVRFHAYLDEYLTSDRPAREGIPTVADCAD